MIAYVSLPSDISREEYISYCLKTQSLTIETLSGGFYNRVPISIVNLNLIRFPVKLGERGSQVVCIEEGSQPIVVTVLGEFDSLGDTSEGDMKYFTSTRETHVEVRGSVKSQTLNMFVKGDENPSLILKVFNNRKLKGKLLLEVDGDIISIANSSIENTSYNQILNTVNSNNPDEELSSYVKQTKDSIETSSKKIAYIDTESFNIGKADEPMVKGNSLDTLLNKILDEVSNITVTTSSGVVPIMNKAQMLLLKDEVKTILSQIANLE